MNPAALLTIIEAATSNRDFVEKTLFSDTPWIFRGDASRYSEWRTTTARASGLTPDGIYLVGSAATGYSLSPFKPGREFRPIDPGVTHKSDIDIAVVNDELFVNSWNSILRYDRARRLSGALSGAWSHKQPILQQIDRMRLNIYWGTISHAHTTQGSAESRVLRTLFSATTREDPFQGYDIKARIYRRREDLLSYHEQSLQQLKVKLRELKDAK